MKPLANRDALLLEYVGDQLVVYDQTRRRLHVLSRSAALVWQHCNGEREVAQLAEIAVRELGTAVDDEVVLLALQQLDEAGLLRTPQRSAPHVDSMTRRAMMRRALEGLGAGVLMPIVTSCGSLADSLTGVSGSDSVSDLATTLAPTTPPPTTTLAGTTPQATTTLAPTTPPPTTTLSPTTPPPTTTLAPTTPPPTTTLAPTTPPPTTTTTTTVATTTTPPAGRKVQMCHRGRTIMVDERAVAAHLAKGDTLGACPE